MFFLLLCLTIKEHVSLVACIYGLYAFFLKRDKKWIILPLILGIAWGLFSLWIMHHFQQIYHQDPQPAWLIENLKHRFLGGEGLQTSVLGNSNSLSYVYLLFSAVGIFLPLCSPIILLGLPELVINLMADFPLFYPTWHYTIIVSCFIMIACVEGIKKLSSGSVQRQQLLSWGLCICILSHFFLWETYMQLDNHPRRVPALKKAIDVIPADASVSAPPYLVGYVSSRRDYFLLSDKRMGNYILVDSNQRVKNYTTIFSEDGISVYKKDLSVVP